MSPFWAVLLLCSQLTSSQGRGIMLSPDQADVDVPVAKRGRQKPSGRLLGGNLLSGLLGGDGALGGLLGGDGALGGLLGEGGALGGLLGEGGAVGSLLGKDGVLGGLLGEGGAVGSLLGKDGVLGGLLGEDGAVGSLLGKDGVLGGLLGGDGAVGTLLGKDGVLGGLLGEDGVLDGLLGKDGLLDGLLGKDGLVDSLLDAVLDILIGKHGILGKNGLVGSLLGGNDGDLPGPKIVANTLPKISLRSLPGFGHEVGFNTQLLVETTSAPGKDLCVQVEVDAVMMVQDKLTAHQSNQDCETVEINIHVRPKMPILEQPLKHLLKDHLSEVGCDIVNAKPAVMSSVLGPGTPVLPLGALGDLPPFSIVSPDAIQMDLNLPAGAMVGGPVTSVQGPPLTASLMLATGRPPRLGVPRRVLDVLLEPQRQGHFNQNITDSMVPGSTVLSSSSLLPFLPQLARVLPGSLPLELHVRVADKPLVAVRDGRATTTLKASIEVTSPSLQSPQKLLFSLDADIVLSIAPSVSDGKLRLSLALDSINLTRAPPRLDPASVSSLAGWLREAVTAGYIPALNDALHASVPLPSIANASLRSADVDISEADNLPDQTTLKGSCSVGPLSLVNL